MIVKFALLYRGELRVLLTPHWRVITQPFSTLLSTETGNSKNAAAKERVQKRGLEANTVVKSCYQWKSRVHIIYVVFSECTQYTRGKWCRVCYCFYANSQICSIRVIFSISSGSVFIISDTLIMDRRSSISWCILLAEIFNNPIWS